MNDENLNLEEMKKIEELKKQLLKKILSRHAFERLSRIKLVKPQLANQLELYLVQLYQSGKINSEITDVQLKNILEGLGTKKEYKIIR